MSTISIISQKQEKSPGPPNLLTTSHKNGPSTAHAEQHDAARSNTTRHVRSAQRNFNLGSVNHNTND